MQRTKTGISSPKIVLASFAVRGDWCRMKTLAHVTLALVNQQFKIMEEWTCASSNGSVFDRLYAGLASYCRFAEDSRISWKPRNSNKAHGYSIVCLLNYAIANLAFLIIACACFILFTFDVAVLRTPSKSARRQQHSV